MAYPMIGTTSLSLAFTLPQAIAMMAFPSLIVNLIVLSSNNKQRFVQEALFYFKKYRLLILSSIIGGVVGIQLLVLVKT